MLFKWHKSLKIMNERLCVRYTWHQINLFSAMEENLNSLIIIFI